MDAIGTNSFLKALFRGASMMGTVGGKRADTRQTDDFFNESSAQRAMSGKGLEREAQLEKQRRDLEFKREQLDLKKLQADERQKTLLEIEGMKIKSDMDRLKKEIEAGKFERTGATATKAPVVLNDYVGEGGGIVTRDPVTGEINESK